MNPAITAAAEQIVAQRRAPGLVLAVAHGDAPPEIVAIGEDGAGHALTPDSLFPVASITKLAVALLTLHLAGRGLLALDDDLALYLPHAAAAQPGVTIRSLLCHTSGLPTDIPPALVPYSADLTAAALLAACAETPLETLPQRAVRYSNVAFGLLALLAEEVGDAPFVPQIQRLVLAPLGVRGYFGEEPPDAPAVIADVRGDHRRTAIEPFNSAHWRGLALPWAGLITDAAGALRLVMAFADRSGALIAPTLRDEATRSQTGDLAGGFVAPLLWDPCPWGLGVEVRGVKLPHWVPLAAGAASFGHSGGSGCHGWVSEERGVAWFLHGLRAADGGWLLRSAPAIGEAVLAG